ncbi:ester cyclase [Acidobacteriota bacterium]
MIRGHVRVKGDKVSGWYIFTGTHSGELAGIPAAGNKVEASALTIFRFEDGKIIEIREQPDLLGLMQQLGMELKPKEKEESIH